MKRAFAIGFAIAALTTAAIGQSPQDSRGPAGSETRGPEQARKTIDTYCVGCHNSRARVAGLALDTLSLDAVAEHADVWEKAVRKLRGRLMPPPGSRQPAQGEIDTFVSWMETTLDAGAANGRVAGHVPIQRLTRTEFGSTVNDLLGIELDPESLLPAEIEVQGFDNIAAALSISPAFLDRPARNGDRSEEIVTLLR